MWLQQTTVVERRALIATFAGYGVDGFDYMIYTFVIPTLLGLWGMSRAEAGFIATGSLLSAAAGGWAAGVLADRFGRVRLLQITVLWFALFTGLCGFTDTYRQLLWTRVLQGFGFGGEWSVGAVLIAETIASRNRGKAAGLVQSSWAVGWAAAALAYGCVFALIPPPWGWRILFWLGILPALLVLYIRRHVVEPPLHAALREAGAAAGHFLDIFRPPLLRTSVLASLLSCGMMAAYYSVTTWLPTFLRSERHLSVQGTSGYLLVLIGGSLAGYWAGAWLSDALGRRRCCMLFAAGGCALILCYLRVPVTDGQMLLLGFPLGFFLSGIFSGMGAFLAELYPTAVRGSGQGFCYNSGRAAGAFCPALIGLWSAHLPLGEGIAWMTAAADGLVIAAAWSLPETRGRELPPDAGAAAAS